MIKKLITWIVFHWKVFVDDFKSSLIDDDDLRLGVVI